MGEIFIYHTDKSAHCLICNLPLKNKSGVGPHSQSKQHQSNLITYEQLKIIKEKERKLNAIR